MEVDRRDAGRVQECISKQLPSRDENRYACALRQSEKH